MAQFNQNLTSVGLNTLTFTMPQAGAYFIEGKISLPTISNGGGVSACLVTITNGTGPVTIYTGIAGAEGFYTTFAAAAGDQGINNVKSVISLGLGE